MSLCTVINHSQFFVAFTMSGCLLFRVSIPADEELEQALTDILTLLDVKNPIWLQGSEDCVTYTYRQVLFYLKNGPEAEEAIKLLTKEEIGVKPHSSIGLFQCYLLYEGNNEPSQTVKIAQHEDDFYTWAKFMESMRPRLAIAQVAETVKYKASLRFDFLVLLIIAGLTASLGLVVDNQLILAASMLISPLMNPMVAATFGMVIRDWKLQKLGIINGLFGLFFCLIIGFLYGITTTFIQGFSPTTEWPTGLMYSMGTIGSLWTGAMLAVLSGAAVSIGILGDEPASIHGVAMSAALLPPAVNAGLLWSRSAVLLGVSTFPGGSSKIWSSNPPTEFAILGAVSLSLSFLNILFIFIAGIFLLKAKEAASWERKNDITWKILKNLRAFSKDESQRISNGSDREEMLNQGRTFPRIIVPEKLPGGLLTWYANRSDFPRPTAQDMTARLTSPCTHCSDIRSNSQGLYGRTTNCSATPKSRSPILDDFETPHNPRFTVVPVSKANQ